MNTTTKIRQRCSRQSLTHYNASSQLVFAACACTAMALLLATPAPATAGKINSQTGQPQLTARQTARLDKLHSDTRAVAIARAIAATHQPLYRQVIPLRPNWLAPKGQR